jgi:filamentous hemagglutinin
MHNLRDLPKPNNKYYKNGQKLGEIVSIAIIFKNIAEIKNLKGILSPALFSLKVSSNTLVISKVKSGIPSAEVIKATHTVVMAINAGKNSSSNGGNKGNIPVKDKTKASNGLDYQSNQKHTPGQPGNRPNAGIEPQNSLDLFGESIPSTKKPNQRFTFDKKTIHYTVFFEDGNGTWHWSGSTNQGANSIHGSKVPTDIKNIFNLPKKGW